MLHWDVNNGVARRAWARNPNARAAIQRAMDAEPLLKVTLPNQVDFDLIDRAFEEMAAFDVEQYNPINTVDLLIDED